jgi:preprotein translocase subunit SecD
MNRFSVIILFVASLVFVTPAFSQNETQAQQLYNDQMQKIQWKDVAIEFRPVTDKSTKGSQPMVVKSVDQENGKTYYVGKTPILGIKDISNMDVTYNPNDLGLIRLIMRFNKDAKKTLQDYTTQHIGEMMGVIIDGQLRLVAHIRQPLVNGKVQVYGFTPNEAVDIANRYYKPKLELARQIQELQNKK